MTISSRLDDFLGNRNWLVVDFDGRRALDANELDEREEARGAFEQPEWMKLIPTATHAIRDGQPVCNGDRTNRCHWYPTCDRHESWPCGCEYTAHDECWVLPWLTAAELADTALDSALERRDDDSLDFPDGLIEWEWEGECVLWEYAAEPPVDGQVALMRHLVHDPDGEDQVMVERADIAHLLKLAGVEA
jgi:hypothetical protein